MGLVSHRRLPVFSSGLRALLRAGGLSGAGLRPTRVEKYFPLSGKNKVPPDLYTGAGKAFPSRFVRVVNDGLGGVLVPV